MKRKRILLVILIIIWAVAVFMLSNQGSEGSSSTSFKFTAFFIKDEALVEVAEPYFRKIAHFCEYAYGGCLFILLFNTYEWSESKTIFISILMGTWYSIFDEIHQYMVPGRTGRIVDVYLDTLGVATGVLFIMIIKKIIEKRKM